MADEVATPPPISVRINPDGSVTFENLPPELLELAQSLDPDALLACEAITEAPGPPKST